MPRKKGRLSREQLASEADIQLRDNTKEVLEKFWSRVKTKLDAGDSKTMEMVSRMFQYDKGPGGVTIFNQHLQVNAAASQEQVARVRSFDQIIGKLEDQEAMTRQDRMLAAPQVENSDDDDDEEDLEDADEITEAETEELVGVEQ